MSSSNPARRLHNLLKRLLDVQKGGNSLDEALSHLWRLDPLDYTRLLTRVSSTMKLVGSVERAIKKVPDINHDVYLGWVSPVRSAFTIMNWKQDFTSWRNNSFSRETMAVIAICDDTLRRIAPEPQLDEAKLSTIRSDAWELLGAVMQADDIDSRLREFIERHLVIIIQGLDDAEFTGVESLSVGLEQLIGAYYVNRGEATEAKETSWGKRLWEIIGAYVILTAAVVQTIQISQEIAKALPMLDSSKGDASAGTAR